MDRKEFLAEAYRSAMIALHVCNPDGDVDKILSALKNRSV
jgi:hypothetical protein